WYDRYAGACEQPLQTCGAEDRREKFCSCAKSDCSKEERNAEFTKREVGIRGHMPDLFSNPSHASEDQCYDEWTACETEADWLWQTGKWNRQSAESDPEDDSDKERNEVGTAQFLC